METIKINLKTPVYKDVLLADPVIESVSSDTVTLHYSNGVYVTEGDILVFKRYVDMKYFDKEVPYTATTLVSEMEVPVLSVEGKRLTAMAPKREYGNYLYTDGSYTPAEERIDGRWFQKAKISKDMICFPGDANEREIYAIFNNVSDGISGRCEVKFCEEDSLVAGTIYDEDYTTYYVSRNEFFTTADIKSMSGKTVWVEFEENPFFYKTDEGFVFWHGHGTKVTVSKKTGYINVPVPASSDVDYKMLNMEENISKIYSKTFGESLMATIPPVNMERVKYEPMVSEENDLSMASGVVFNLHFRERNKDEKWTLKDEGWWNGISGKNRITNSNAYHSDLLGDLNFTDTDVYNRKMKLRKSFIRLSFYDSPSPLEQHLLYYSTIFVDTGSLYGKYIKLKNVLPVDTAIVDYSGTTDTNYNTLLTSQIKVHDEFCTDNSSEGYNIYLFEDDADKTDNEKDYRTIYMKVEYNHAKYGRTIPMMLWYPGCDWTVNNLDARNLLDNLYCEVRIKYLENGKYVYWFPDANNDKDSMSITLNLFEPRLEKLPDTKDI